MSDSRPLPALIASLSLEDYCLLTVHVTRGALVDAVTENNKLRELVRDIVNVNSERIAKLRDELGF